MGYNNFVKVGRMLNIRKFIPDEVCGKEWKMSFPYHSPFFPHLDLKKSKIPKK